VSEWVSEWVGLSPSYNRSTNRCNQSLLTLSEVWVAYCNIYDNFGLLNVTLFILLDRHWTTQRHISKEQNLVFLNCDHKSRQMGDLYWVRSFHLLTHLRSWALLEKLPIVQQLKNFPAFYGTRRFITVFTRALHWFVTFSILITLHLEGVPYNGNFLWISRRQLLIRLEFIPKHQKLCICHPQTPSICVSALRMRRNFTYTQSWSRMLRPLSFLFNFYHMNCESSIDLIN
jgi:hypothetical protein